MKSKTVKSCLLFTLVTVFFVFAGCAFENIDSDETEKVFTSQDCAMDAGDILLNSFDKDNNGMYIYPENYAGEWIDENILHIALTSSQKTAINEYKTILEGYECVKFVKVEYSLNELVKIQRAASEYFAHEHYLTAYYVDFKLNKMVFEFEELDEEKLKEIVADQLNSDKPFGLDCHVAEDMFEFQEGSIMIPQ